MDKNQANFQYLLNYKEKIESLLNFPYKIDALSPNLHCQTEFDNFVLRLHNCSSMNIQTNKINESTGEIKTFSLDSSCCGKTTICPICAHNKRSKIIRSIMPAYNTLIEMQHDNKIFLYEGCATISGSENISYDYDKLRESWTNFFKKGQKRKNGARSSGEASKIIGSMISIECKQTDKIWHIHGHFLLIASSKIRFDTYDQTKIKELYAQYGYKNIPEDELNRIRNDVRVIDGKEYVFSKLSSEWFEASHGKGINIFIKPLKSGLNNNGKYCDIHEKIYELVKYITKIDFMENEDIFQIWDSLRNKKRVTFSGILRTNADRAAFFPDKYKEMFLDFCLKYEIKKDDDDIEIENIIIEKQQVNKSYKNIDDEKNYKFKSYYQKHKGRSYHTCKLSANGKISGKERTIISILEKITFVLKFGLINRNIIEYVDSWHIENYKKIKEKYKKQRSVINLIFNVSKDIPSS